MDALTCIESWFKAYHGRPPEGYEIHIDTIDNPGWVFRLFLDRNDEEVLFKDELDEEHWIHLFVRGGGFEGVAGAGQLGDVVRAFLEHVGEPWGGRFEEDPLARLQEWYRSRCDGDWEHNGGVKVASTGEDKWLLELQLNYGSFPNRERRTWQTERYWPEEEHPVPEGATVSESEEKIVVEGPLRAVTEYMMGLRPLQSG